MKMDGSHEFLDGSSYSLRREEMLTSTSYLVGYIHDLLTSKVLSLAASQRATMASQNRKRYGH